MKLRIFLLVLCGGVLSFSFMKKPVEPPKPINPLPSEAQLAWQKMEMVSFVHFTTNTFTDLEWGKGDEPESVFNPTEPDPVQWAKELKNAGFKELIFTCKHHDGFCLWPSKYTDHSIKNSPYKNGSGDMVREVSDACKIKGIKFGIYLSPWDRNRADYAQPSYITYYRNQLTELITNYGPYQNCGLTVPMVVTATMVVPMRSVPSQLHIMIGPTPSNLLAVCKKKI